MTDFRTPAKIVRGSGSAKDGTTHFWRQRLTALANIPLLLFFTGFIVSLNGASHEEVIAAVSYPLTAIALIAVLVSALIHMKLGMQVVIEDYIHGEGAKIICLFLNSIFTYGIGLTAVFAILKISFGA
ncbi:MAG: succinate dehydrogenase, hydrophobic membrane anchor protein [Rhizobiaceae bacterium]